MTARGVDFLDDWLARNVSGVLVDPAKVGVLAAKLLADGLAAGFTLSDMGVDEETVEDYIREVIVYLGGPGTPGG